MGEAEEAITLKIVITVMIILFLLSLSVIVFFVIYQRRLLEQQKKHQKLESDYQRELLKTSILSQERERNRIAKELHDDVGAMLTTTKLYFDQIASELSPTEFNSISSKVKGFFEDMIHSVRTISQDLRPMVLERLGLVEAVQSLVQTINESGKIKISFLNHTACNLPKTGELNLYRIIQELINNTIKHAEASYVKIELQDEEKKLILKYKDDGKGFQNEQIKIHKGLGLKNIESRVSILDGNINFYGNNGGVKIMIEIPI